MTKHEAIKKLIALFGPDPETNEAIKLAMIALGDTLDEPDPKPAKAQNSNQETQKSNGDLIYRADAIQTFIRWGQKEFGFMNMVKTESFGEDGE